MILIMDLQRSTIMDSLLNYLSDRGIGFITEDGEAPETIKLSIYLELGEFGSIPLLWYICREVPPSYFRQIVIE